MNIVLDENNKDINEAVNFLRILSDNVNSFASYILTLLYEKK